jgi:hypothetical protein
MIHIAVDFNEPEEIYIFIPLFSRQNQADKTVDSYFIARYSMYHHAVMSAPAQHRIYFQGHHSSGQNNKLYGQLGLRSGYNPLTSTRTPDSFQSTPGAQQCM